MATKDHAIHNEEACDFLLSSGKFNDWVVTTAFYSAMQFVCNELFPLEQNNVIFDSFERYYHLNFKNTVNRQSKHLVIISLVNSNLPLCVKFYRSLYDQCMKARYTNYKVSLNIAIKVRKDLDNLKRQLEKL